jgi:hypothetical protein
MTEVQTPIEELEAFEAAIGAHIKTLEDWAAATEKNSLHVIPKLQPGPNATTQIVVDIHNFGDSAEGGGGTTQMEGVPATYFYEAYREKVGEIFELALEKAKGGVQEKAKAIKARLDAEKKELAAADKALTKYLKPNGARRNK